MKSALRATFLSLTLIWMGAFSHHLLAAENVILITIDGMRWQEVFGGIDLQLANNKAFNPRGEALTAQFAATSGALSAEKIMPFLHRVVFKQGVVVGDKARNSCAQVSNDWYFSSPGYSEILTGVVDPTIDSNAKVLNRNKSYMELLQGNAKFAGEARVFASWDVFPFILNTERSKIPVNVDAQNADGDPLNNSEALLNVLAKDIPQRWEAVRFDAFTHHKALASIRNDKPKLLYIAYGETDDFAHDGRYDEYILAAARTDRFIKEVWAAVNADPSYADKTVIFITTDHGRGAQPLETWKHHASKKSLDGYMQSLKEYKNGIEGSEDVWMAAMGAGVPATGLLTTDTQCLTSDRIAATLMALLGENAQRYNPDMGKLIKAFVL
jgi:hypothetical protein